MAFAYPSHAGVPRRSFRSVEAWGMAHRADQRVLHPRSVEEVRAALDVARADGVGLGPRGSGCSYGDASVSTGNHALDITSLDRVLSFDPETGIADCEAGVTIEGLWKTALAHGWWPRVVSGTMFPTLAGALGANIHGKNHYKVGSIGDAVLDLDVLLPSGELRTLDREREPELFHAVIGGLGLLGVITRVRLATKKVHSGDLEVRAATTLTIGAMMRYFEQHRATSDYLVGWIDCFGRGQQLGRGLIHDARYLTQEEAPARAARAGMTLPQTFALAHQDLPPNILGVVPKGEVWHALEWFVNDPGMRLVNGAKMVSGAFEANRPPYLQSHAAFAFLLDYVPHWKRAYGKGGLIQYQPFVPHATAEAVYEECLRWCHRKGIVPYLGVFKRHREDPFLLAYTADGPDGGWSLAMDFKVTPANRAALWAHTKELSEIVLEGGGRFYFAKDLVIGPEETERMLRPGALETFLRLKRELDPEGLLVTDLWRRVFAPLAGA